MEEAETGGEGEKNETLSKSRREGTGTSMRAFSIHDPFAPLLQQARIGRERGEINSPVLILTDSTAKWLVARFHQSAGVITGVPRSSVRLGRSVCGWKSVVREPSRDPWISKSQGFS